MSQEKLRVLISDKLHDDATKVFEKNQIPVDIKTGLSPEELCQIIPQYDGLAIRSATTVTAEILAAATKLRVIARAGIGVDNVDIPAATKQGVLVMNTPFGNSITTAEHAISMLLSLARQIPQANQSTHAGLWEKSKFTGTEVYEKCLGLVGVGNIGSLVAERAKGLKMNVIACDPFFTEERSKEIGVEKVEMDELLSRADFMSFHTPLNDSTRNLLNAKTMAKCKKGVLVVNCARGGIIDENDLLEGLNSGQIGGAALDVFAEEPAKKNVLFNHPRAVLTPHLGAATSEAQIRVAVQAAEQICDFLLRKEIKNGLNKV